MYKFFSKSCEAVSSAAAYLPGLNDPQIIKMREFISKNYQTASSSVSSASSALIYDPLVRYKFLSKSCKAASSAASMAGLWACTFGGGDISWISGNLGLFNSNWRIYAETISKDEKLGLLDVGVSINSIILGIILPQLLKNAIENPHLGSRITLSLAISFTRYGLNKLSNYLDKGVIYFEDLASYERLSPLRNTKCGV